ncbi:MAG: hypothetical protein EHM71_10905 [Zetaproteobacteria bacterium]|nr:MAG: hypothetical protein EHM71_10905 [Zetaproteobacteria bacterium]
MRRGAWCVLTVWALSLAVIPAGNAQEDVYYARCNLKVMDDNEITWINWQAAPTLVPVGTKFQVTRTKDKASLANVETKATYKLDIGADGDAYLEKFVTRRRVDIEAFPEEVRENIRKAIARIGMTKEQVYIAMGPPTNVGQKRTHAMTYDQIMASDLWVYARRRFGKNIGVAFDPSTGRVNRTEGIWGKD